VARSRPRYAQATRSKPQSCLSPVPKSPRTGLFLLRGRRLDAAPRQQHVMSSKRSQDSGCCRIAADDWRSTRLFHARDCLHRLEADGVREPLSFATTVTKPEWLSARRSLLPYRAHVGNCRYAHRLVPLIRVLRRAFGSACGPSPLETGTVS